jgi:serine protease AprX
MTTAGEPARDEGRFDGRMLHRSVIAIPLLDIIKEAVEKDRNGPIDVVIDVNLNFAGGRVKAMEQAEALIRQVIERRTGVHADERAVRHSGTYLAAGLPPAVIRDVVELDRAVGSIFHIWPDFRVNALLDRSVATIKADAARASFSAAGRDITWAVLDTGIDTGHSHFTEFENTRIEPLEHLDFTGSGVPATDTNGHGTHVAGIIAGHQRVTGRRKSLGAVRFELTEDEDDVTPTRIDLAEISGVAPECRIVGYKVLGDDGTGRTSDIISALNHIRDVNDTGRVMKIHGVNLSLGYDFDPEWFACGQSPLCVEVDRLVRSGVVVVIAAGNTGYAHATDALKKASVAAGRALTINDPGNTESAITVGSTHREMPHLYGVSYFSSKGPTGDGRAKPDLLAPGERILSAATGAKRDKAVGSLDGRQFDVRYAESSGTSMAAPHVSGAIAAFLSIRREFIGHPDRVKQIFTASATDLGRVRDFQGYGLVDLMRAIQSV